MSLFLSQVEHGPTQVFRTPFRDAVDAPGADLVSIATIEAPWGTERLSNRPFSPPEHGNYRHRIVGLTEVGPAISPRAHSLGALETSIVLDDSDQYLHKLLHAYHHRLGGSVVTLQTAVRGLPAAHWHTYFKGVVDSWPLVPAGYNLIFRTRDLALRTAFPRRRVTLADRPNAPAASVGRYYQGVYGVYDYSGVAGHGLIPALEVDSVAFIYHLSLGRLGAVRAVFADAALVPTSGYAVSYPLTNGFRETVIDFTTSQAGKTITADVDGLTDSGTGGGRVLTQPMEILLHWLANWVYGDWFDGAWLDPSLTPAGLPSFWQTEQFLRRNGLSPHAATLFFGGDDQSTDALTILEALARTFHVHPYWWDDGSLEVAPINPHQNRWMLERPWVRGRYHDIDSAFSMPQNTRQVVNRVTVGWLPIPATGQFSQSLDVEDLTVDETAALAQDLDNSQASL